ncbi:MAG: hypothetical protein JWQ96_3330, partial [Segetibacter sp.]|nr:hypothetical protein [Segetibacter sp.]
MFDLVLDRGVTAPLFYTIKHKAGSNIWNKKMSDRIQSKQEEVANALTHGVGFLLALTLVPVLIARATATDTIQMKLAAALFSFGILMSYLSSTVYHVVQNANLKKHLRIWDHISIFFLIGGTYTPIICKYTPSSTAIIFLI